MALGGAEHLVAMTTPQGRGAFHEQAVEAMTALQEALETAGPGRMTVLAQTVFLREAGDQAEFERLLREFYNVKLPVMSFVLQPPCSGAALSTEVWAVGGDEVRVEDFGSALAASHGALRWVWCAGAAKPYERGTGDAYGQTLSVFEQMRFSLEAAGSGFERVVRTWFYLGGINQKQPEADNGRYEQLNRARSDFYSGIRFHPSSPAARGSKRVFYPSSTGIGMAGSGLAAGCLALEFSSPGGKAPFTLLPLENPLQTPAYDYQCGCASDSSPEFSRAMALLEKAKNSVMIWISGTASIVRSESRHPDDAEKQTEQTIGNIERLIAKENFSLHGVEGAGATLRDLAAVRVYIKRPEDFYKCRTVCEKKFSSGVPIIYTVADICRPELLVEIEAMAFSSRPPA